MSWHAKARARPRTALRKKGPRSTVQSGLQLPGGEMADELLPLRMLELEEACHEARAQKGREVGIGLQGTQSIQEVLGHLGEAGHFWRPICNLVHVHSRLEEELLRAHGLLHAEEARSKDDGLQHIGIHSTIRDSDLEPVIRRDTHHVGAIVAAEGDTVWCPCAARSCGDADEPLVGVHRGVAERAERSGLGEHPTQEVQAQG
mmetsp:Transcript_40381/g.91152  ORF Transcript_40381/g.91152 Transcript_40381/m.91152 type:complete len:203 (-) Transcript_40381:888-1496(-)